MCNNNEVKNGINYYHRQFEKCLHSEAREIALEDVGFRFGRAVKDAVREATKEE